MLSLKDNRDLKRMALRNTMHLLLINWHLSIWPDLQAGNILGLMLITISKLNTRIKYWSISYCIQSNLTVIAKECQSLFSNPPHPIISSLGSLCLLKVQIMLCSIGLKQVQMSKSKNFSKSLSNGQCKDCEH